MGSGSSFWVVKPGERRDEQRFLEVRDDPVSVRFPTPFQAADRQHSRDEGALSVTMLLLGSFCPVGECLCVCQGRQAVLRRGSGRPQMADSPLSGGWFDAPFFPFARLFVPRCLLLCSLLPRVGLVVVVVLFAVVAACSACASTGGKAASSLWVNSAPSLREPAWMSAQMLHERCCSCVRGFDRACRAALGVCGLPLRSGSRL